MKWKLAACRINKGLKQKDVAELMHTSNTTIVNHETGKVKPTIAQLKMYPQIYGIPENDIDCEIRKQEQPKEHLPPAMSYFECLFASSISSIEELLTGIK